MIYVKINFGKTREKEIPQQNKEHLQKTQQPTLYLMMKY